MSKETLSFVTHPPPKYYKISSAFSYNFISALTQILFPYAAIFVAPSFVTMCFVRHGDSRASVKRGLDAFEDMDG